MIWVFGSSGTVGGLIARRLLELNVPFSAVNRNNFARQYPLTVSFADALKHLSGSTESNLIVNCIGSTQIDSNMNFSELYVGNYERVKQIVSVIENGNENSLVHYSSNLLNSNWALTNKSFYALTKLKAELFISERSSTCPFQTTSIRLPTVLSQSNKGSAIVQTLIRNKNNLYESEIENPNMEFSFILPELLVQHFAENFLHGNKTELDVFSSHFQIKFFLETCAEISQSLLNKEFVLTGSAKEYNSLIIKKELDVESISRLKELSLIKFIARLVNS